MAWEDEDPHAEQMQELLSKAMGAIDMTRELRDSSTESAVRDVRMHCLMIAVRQFRRHQGGQLGIGLILEHAKAYADFVLGE